MSNATMPSFKDSEGRIWEVTGIHFSNENAKLVCEISAFTDPYDVCTLTFFKIYSDGRFIHGSQQRVPDITPIESAFYNAVMAMFNLNEES